MILVEGDTETIVFREFLNEYFPEKDIFVLNTGSKTNMQFFQEVLTHFKIKHYVVHDTDTRDKASSWTINQGIWDKIEVANKEETGLAKRYVFVTDFETTNGYKYSYADGKPLSAYKFARKVIDEKSNPTCLEYLKDIVGDKKINHDQEYIDKNVPK